MDKRTIKSVLKKIEAEKAKVSASRDRIRALIDAIITAALRQQQTEADALMVDFTQRRTA